MWYRIDSKNKSKGAHLTGFPELIFQDGYVFTTDESAVASARSAAQFGVTRLQNVELEAGFHLDKFTGNPVAFDGQKIIPLGFGGGDFAAIVADVGGIVAGQPVVMGAESGTVSAILNAGAYSGGERVGAWDVVGVAVTSAGQGQQITIRASGLAMARAGEPITRNMNVLGSGAVGRFYLSNPPSTTTGAGNTGIRWRLRRASHGGHTNTVQIAVSGTNTPFGITVSAGLVRIDSATDGSGDPVTTAAQIVEAVNAHPMASQLVILTLLGDGSQAPGSATSTFSVNLQSVNTVGIALADADTDELFPMLIRPR